MKNDKGEEVVGVDSEKLELTLKVIHKLTIDMDKVNNAVQRLMGKMDSMSETVNLLSVRAFGSKGDALKTLRATVNANKHLDLSDMPADIKDTLTKMLTKKKGQNETK